MKLFWIMLMEILIIPEKKTEHGLDQMGQNAQG